MRSTKLVSVWPVGLVGKLRYESPIICDGKVCYQYTCSFLIMYVLVLLDFLNMNIHTMMILYKSAC